MTFLLLFMTFLLLFMIFLLLLRIVVLLLSIPQHRIVVLVNNNAGGFVSKSGATRLHAILGRCSKCNGLERWAGVRWYATDLQAEERLECQKLILTVVVTRGRQLLRHEDAACLLRAVSAMQCDKMRKLTIIATAGRSREHSPSSFLSLTKPLCSGQGLRTLGVDGIIDLAEKVYTSCVQIVGGFQWQEVFQVVKQSFYDIVKEIKRCLIGQPLPKGLVEEGEGTGIEGEAQAQGVGDELCVCVKTASKHVTPSRFPPPPMPLSAIQPAAPSLSQPHTTKRRSASTIPPPTGAPRHLYTIINMAPTSWSAAADIKLSSSLEQNLALHSLHGSDQLGIAKRFIHDYAYLVYAAACLSNATNIWPNSTENIREVMKWVEKANIAWGAVSSELGLQLHRMTQDAINDRQGDIEWYALGTSDLHSGIHAVVKEYVRFSFIEPVLAKNAKYWGLVDEDDTRRTGSAQLEKATDDLWSALENPIPSQVEARNAELDPVREQDRMHKTFGIRARMAEALQPLLTQYRKNGFGVADEATLEALRPVVQQYKKEVAQLAVITEYAESPANKGVLRIAGPHVDLILPGVAGSSQVTRITGT
ncbi:hypothetical protein M409DRAFT_52044 [Zasmidium cellare ATCC 36951]|uniref:Uncharacterized protein n=1 Tax=Zasmidium cellare ATCC 36951 TaxID=1080233 RepID=A0A6A6CS17_ZASCE|nr:uncharacterized protein M409DRAFT_52044 [Zasmidium cellare ATCC 36951]KAF2169503.1 hypothetical protein M409DRAFT_52044 [Zasmidium cellare ATCC 36951]